MPKQSPKRKAASSSTRKRSIQAPKLKVEATVEQVKQGASITRAALASMVEQGHPPQLIREVTDWIELLENAINDAEN